MILVLIFLTGFIFGAVLGLSMKKYSGHISISEKPDGGKLYLLELDGDPENIDQMKHVTFRVGSPHFFDEVES